MKTITKNQALAWGNSQRAKRNQGKLKPHEIKSLDELGFEWRSREDMNEDNWNTQFEELSKLDNPNAIRSHELGWWVNKQRVVYKNGKLNAKRIKLLEGIGLIWDPLESMWHSNFKELSKLDSPNVTRSHKHGNWVNTQCMAYKKGKLNEDKIKLLEGINFIWDPTEAMWNTQFEELSKLDNPNVTQSHELGNWVSKQRVAYKRGKLGEDKIKLLEGIGLIWDAVESMWHAKFKELSNLNNPNVAKSHELGSWVGTQRGVYKKGKISTERIKLLEGIGLIWDPLESKWNTQFEELSELDNPNVSKSHELRRWVNNQRTVYKNEKLGEDKIKLLEGIGLIWDPLESMWHAKFKELSKLDSPNIAQSHELGTWVNTQRTAYRKGKLSTERIKLLEGIGLKWIMNN